MELFAKITLNFISLSNAIWTTVTALKTKSCQELRSCLNLISLYYFENIRRQINSFRLVDIDKKRLMCCNISCAMRRHATLWQHINTLLHIHFRFIVL